MRKSLFIGRFQPLHEGHIKLIQTVIDEGKPVVIGLMGVDIDGKNPYSVRARMDMIREAFGNKVDIMVIPAIAEVCWGRNVGWWPRRIHLDAGTEAITATKIRSAREFTCACGYELELPDELEGYSRYECPNCDTDILGFLAEPQASPQVFHDSEFVEAFDRVSQEVHKIASEQGLWQGGSNRDIWKVIAWGMSEFAEALECYRVGNGPDKNITDMSGLEVQLADVLGILMDMQAGFGLKIAEALQKKMEFNKSRDWLHGGKKC